MNFAVTSNKSLSSRSFIYFGPQFSIGSFSSQVGLEIRTERVAISRFNANQAGNRTINSDVVCKNNIPIKKITY
jgi:hypothetical protein